MPALLRLVYADNVSLVANRLPFLKNQGIFVPLALGVVLGQKIFVLLRTGTEQAAGLATVCWITPQGSSDGHPAGFGLHFDSAADELQRLLTVEVSAEKADDQVQGHGSASQLPLA